VDDEDFEKVSQFKWYASLNDGHYYAMRKPWVNGKPETLLMHRFIMGLKHGNPLQVDHIDNMQTLDNRRSNLRVTLKQNQQNRGMQKNNTTGFKGVVWHKNRHAWQAQIRINGKRLYLGLFPTAEEAAQVYDDFAWLLHGEFARTNKALKEAK
jgi:hypothetical protein